MWAPNRTGHNVYRGPRTQQIRKAGMLKGERTCKEKQKMEFRIETDDEDLRGLKVKGVG